MSVNTLFSFYHGDDRDPHLALCPCYFRHTVDRQSQSCFLYFLLIDVRILFVASDGTDWRIMNLLGKFFPNFLFEPSFFFSSSNKIHNARINHLFSSRNRPRTNQSLSSLRGTVELHIPEENDTMSWVSSLLFSNGIVSKMPTQKALFSSVPLMSETPSENDEITTHFHR